MLVGRKKNGIVHDVCFTNLNAIRIYMNTMYTFKIYVDRKISILSVIGRVYCYGNILILHPTRSDSKKCPLFMLIFILGFRKKYVT